MNIVLGFLLLLFGRRLYWLFVGVAGAIIALQVTPTLLPTAPQAAALAAAVIFGLLGAILAVFLKKLAIFIGGFLAGTYLILSLIQILNIDFPGRILFSLVLGGILGAVLVSALFDWALIALSAITGSLLVIQSLTLETIFALLIFIALIVSGVILQANMMRRSKG